MSELKVERFVKAPAEIVWRVITDIDGATQRISGINRIERLDQKNEFGIGTEVARNPNDVRQRSHRSHGGHRDRGRSIVCD